MSAQRKPTDSLGAGTATMQAVCRSAISMHVITSGSYRHPAGGGRERFPHERLAPGFQFHSRGHKLSVKARGVRPSSPLVSGHLFARPVDSRRAHVGSARLNLIRERSQGSCKNFREHPHSSVPFVFGPSMPNHRTRSIAVVRNLIGKVRNV